MTGGGDAAANPLRGESFLMIGGRERRLRPTFAALVAAEEDLGSLFELVERAGDGKLRLSEMSALFWHCLADRSGIGREDVGAAVVEQGLAASAPALRSILKQVLQGLH
ncbi:gene transfer agent family protein [Croceicoccus sp. F390]|uniref:Gene transfer agent family protein n=1 Tax=Croceicoccus esteveae TaxID=3075597 RepID=A0ABU2ZJY4_9SPHN|nr:gene transfer agent family protein [Croceicoccus sp. F390]MDT0576531.1 gene transfer agent family protein [Croceicoccus sp. F390]